MSFAYALLAGDDAVPEHEVDGAIWQRRRLGHEALKKEDIGKDRINAPALKLRRGVDLSAGYRG